MPADPIEREALAHRLVAERCLYGVDKNPMAVEMAKLSLWLITLAKDRPFSFVDHALRAGDSLLGVTDLNSSASRTWTRAGTARRSLDLGFDEIEAAVDRALALRRELEAFVVRDVLDAERKAAMLARGRRGARRRAAARRPRRRRRARRSSTTPTRSTPPTCRATSARCSTTTRPSSSAMVARTQLCALADTWLVETARVDEFPRSSGMTATRSTGRLSSPRYARAAGLTRSSATRRSKAAEDHRRVGEPYRDYLVEWLGGRARGNADLVAYFYLRASQAAARRVAASG